MSKIQNPFENIYLCHLFLDVVTFLETSNKKALKCHNKVSRLNIKSEPHISSFWRPF